MTDDLVEIFLFPFVLVGAVAWLGTAIFTLQAIAKFRPGVRVPFLVRWNPLYAVFHDELLTENGKRARHRAMICLLTFIYSCIIPFALVGILVGFIAAIDAAIRLFSS